jgi:2-polyprenyl-3-methyl-5-hydroxy-6-metoxy-1,4-benzoquinol methylase
VLFKHNSTGQKMHSRKHKYEYNPYLKGDNSASHILRMTNHNANVLEIGAGPGSITKLLINTLNCNVSAIEIDKTAIERLKKFCNSIYTLDLNNDSWPEQIIEKGTYDIVLAADVLEHLNNPLTALINMKKMIHDKGSVIVSLPHVGHNSIYACLLENDFAYSDSGLLDKTHIRFFGIKNMQALFDNAGLKIIDVGFVLRKPEDTELADKWRKVPQSFKLLLEKNKFGYVYQCVIKATPNQLTTESIQIYDMNINNPANSVIRRANRFAKRFLPNSFYQYLRNFYQKINSK